MCGGGWHGEEEVWAWGGKGRRGEEVGLRRKCG